MVVFIKAKPIHIVISKKINTYRNVSIKNGINENKGSP